MQRSRYGNRVESHAKSRRVFWLSLVVVVAAAGGLGGYYLRQRSVDPAPDQVVTAFVGDLTTRTSTRGQVLSQRQANLTLGIAGRVEHIFVQIGDGVETGDVLVQLEAGALERAVRSAEQNLAIQEAKLAELRKGASAEDMAIAEAAVDSAKARLGLLQAGARSEEIAAAEANLRAAQAMVWSAVEQRNQIVAGATGAEITAAEAQVADALAQQKTAMSLHDWTMECYTTTDSETGKKKRKCPRLGAPEENARYRLHVADEALEAAQTQLDLLLAGPPEEQANIANANVSAAVGQRDAAQAQLDLLRAGSSTYQIAIAEADVAQAEAGLVALTAGVSDEQLIIAEAQVEQARIALEEALDNLANAALVSPFDGVVTAVYVSIGEFASGPVVEVVDLNSLEVVVNVYEEDVGAIDIGQAAVLNLQAWPNEDLTGKVVSISPKSSPGDTVTYQVHLSLDVVRENNLPIRPGMSATAELVTSDRENVLLVPNIAIIADRETSTFYVNLWEDRRVIRREVEIGLRDSRYTEIISGLEANDELFIEEEKALELLDFRQGPPREIRELRQ
jgi:RND family efflux transporter MFP subunit